ncbi:MAG: type II toxin-antitoxin system RelE family toxin [Nitrospiraceae bacterium]
MAYSVHLAPAAERQLKALDKPIQQRIVRRLRKLEGNPRPHGIEKLTGSEDFYRIREGDYRIIYTIKDKDLIVLVVKIGHRKDIYRGRLE